MKVKTNHSRHNHNLQCLPGINVFLIRIFQVWGLNRLHHSTILNYLATYGTNHYCLQSPPNYH